MRGSSGTSIGSGTTRFGPAKETGEARAENCGSTRILMPASCTRKAAWPIQVTVGSPPLARSAAESARVCGTFQPPGGGPGTPRRSCSHFQSQKLAGASWG